MRIRDTRQCDAHIRRAASTGPQDCVTQTIRSMYVFSVLCFKKKKKAHALTLNMRLEFTGVSVVERATVCPHWLNGCVAVYIHTDCSPN